MGRGDKRTRKGKIFAGSFGKTRPQGKKKTASVKKEEANKSEEQTLVLLFKNVRTDQSYN